MGIPVVIKATGGLPVTVATSGYGVPMEVATNGYGIAVTQVASGGLPVVGVTFGPSIVLSNNTVLESAAVNTTVGTLSMSGTTGTPTYTLTDSAGGKFNISGALLRTNAALDYETATSHNITVSVSGVAPAVSATSFTVVVLNVTATQPAAPVLTLLTGSTDNTPDFTLTGDLLVLDTVRFQYSTASDFTGASELTNAIDAGEDAANSISFSTGTLANNTWYFRARIERPEAANSDWSNTQTVTIAVSGEDALTTAWYNAVVVTDGGTVSAPRRTLVDALIAGLRTDGVLPKLDRLWIFAAENSKSALRDLIGAQLATTSTVFTADDGYAGFGTEYVLSGFVPGAGGLYAQNSAHIGLWAMTTGTGPGGRQQRHGWLNAATTVGGYISAHSSGTNNVVMNINGAFDTTITAAVACKHVVGNRSAAGAVQLYSDGVSVQTGTTASVALSGAVQISFLSRNLGGSENQGSDEMVSAGHIGGSLTAGEVTSLWNRLRTYMTAVGVP